MKRTRARIRRGRGSIRIDRRFRQCSSSRCARAIGIEQFQDRTRYAKQVMLAITSSRKSVGISQIILILGATMVALSFYGDLMHSKERSISVAFREIFHVGDALSTFPNSTRLRKYATCFCNIYLCLHLSNGFITISIQSFKNP